MGRMNRNVEANVMRMTPAGFSSTLTTNGVSSINRVVKPVEPEKEQHSQSKVTIFYPS